MTAKRKTTPTQEDYLKTILELSELEFSYGEGIRSIDIAAALEVSRASVSHMMQILNQAGYISKEKYGAVTLTEKGRDIALTIKKKYDLLRDFLHHMLGVEADTAARDACRIEHLISTETARQIHHQLESWQKAEGKGAPYSLYERE